MYVLFGQVSFNQWELDAKLARHPCALCALPLIGIEAPHVNHVGCSVLAFPFLPHTLLQFGCACGSCWSVYVPALTYDLVNRLPVSKVADDLNRALEARCAIGNEAQRVGMLVRHVDVDCAVWLCEICGNEARSATGQPRNLHLLFPSNPAFLAAVHLAAAPLHELSPASRAPEPLCVGVPVPKALPGAVRAFLPLRQVHSYPFPSLSCRCNAR